MSHRIIIIGSERSAPCVGGTAVQHTEVVYTPDHETKPKEIALDLSKILEDIEDE